MHLLLLILRVKLLYLLLRGIGTCGQRQVMG
jgi:hypothetical protein